MNNRKETHQFQVAPTIKQNNLCSADQKDGESTVIEKLRDFCGYTSAHGFARLVDSKSYVRKLFWVMACLGAFTMFSCQVIWLAQDYLRRPVETYIAMKHVRDMDFPVVTICNHNIIRRSKIISNDSDLLQQFLKDFLNDLKTTTSQVKDRVKRNIFPQRPDDSQLNKSIQVASITSASTAHVQPSASISVTAMPTSSSTRSRKKTKEKQKKAEIPTTQETERNKAAKEEEESPLADFVARQERLHVALATWPEEQLSKLGHIRKDIFRECTFRGRTCNKNRYWTRFWHYMYGNCFSFNKELGLRAGGAGPGNGLLVEINVEQNEYLGGLTKDAGIRVHIGSPGKVPFPYEKGFSVGPGSATSVGMKKVQIKRVDPFSNGSCMGEEGLAEDNLYRMKYNASYSTTACKESCLSDKQKDLCGCREYRFPKDESKNESVCDVLNATVAKCLAGLMKKYRRSNLGCARRCPSPCNEDVFKLTISTSRFPSLAYERIIQADAKALRKAKIPPNDISSYLLQLNVFFEELNYEVIEENMGYGIVSFISDIGGNVGMFIGVSILTCAEILELLCILIHHIIKNCAKHQSKIKPMKK
ncbi:degenerin-like protein asic-1 isoform X1 [Oculina patagonica]